MRIYTVSSVDCKMEYDFIFALIISLIVVVTYFITFKL
jgi:hypothetical protein